MAGGGGSQRPTRHELLPKQALWPKAPIPKILHFAKNWSTSAAVFGALGGIAVVYFTDWKPVIRYIPFYNGKLNDEN